jgi:Glycosyltransferases involved in cell wall biogenesis
VSVGLPVYNGEQYLAVALGSIVAQDHGNLEIIVSDNASTDRTQEIIAQFAAWDQRIRYTRNDRNIGAPANFNRCFELASGRYFMWMADDDVWDPSYVRKCVAALEANQDAVLACSRVRFIDQAGDPIEMDYTLADNPDLSNRSVIERVRTLTGRGGWYLIYGLIRREELARTRLMTERYGGDVVLVTELLLSGPFVLVPEILHWYRQIKGRSEADRVASLGIEIAALKTNWWPSTTLQEGLADAVRVARLSAMTKLRVQLEILLGAYARSTPISEQTRSETGPRVRYALHHGRPWEFVKYSTLWLLARTPRPVRRVAGAFARRAKGARIRS